MDAKLLAEAQALLGDAGAAQLEGLFGRLQPPALTDKRWVASKRYFDMALTESSPIAEGDDYHGQSVLFRDTYDEGLHFPTCELRVPVSLPHSFTNVEVKATWKLQGSALIQGKQDVFIFQEHVSATPVFVWVVMRLSNDELVLGVNRTANSYSDIVGFSIAP
ncbi:MAG: hypothetical protein AAF938_23350 [Myxococcota bacterium]